jgi:hypothetical protein
MKGDKRKFLRFHCVLPAEIIKLEDKKQLINEVMIDDFSREGIRLVMSFNLKPGSEVELKLQHPHKKTETPVVGEIIWSTGKKNKMEFGLKIKEMNTITKSEIFDYIYEKWLQSRSQKEQLSLRRKVKEKKSKKDK